MEYKDSHLGVYEDFVLPKRERITALNYFNDEYLIYSSYPDFYEFRVLKKVSHRVKRRNKDDPTNMQNLSKTFW